MIFPGVILQELLYRYLLALVVFPSRLFPALVSLESLPHFLFSVKLGYLPCKLHDHIEKLCIDIRKFV